MAKNPGKVNNLWKWAKDSRKKLKRTISWVLDRVKEARKRFQNSRQAAKHDWNVLKSLWGQRRRIKKKINVLKNDLKKEKKQEGTSKYNLTRVHNLKTRIQILNENLQGTNSEIKDTVKHRARKLKRKRHFKDRVKFWLKKKTRFRKRYKKLKKQAQAGQGYKFEIWMLNGKPYTISKSLEEVVAYVVLKHGQVITATSNGGHATSSYHFPWNNSDGKCHAIDFAGLFSRMQEAQRGLKEEFGYNWKELFGPDGWYIKNGMMYSSQFPGHLNHGHAAR